MPSHQPKRWVVPRPGPDGEPLGVLKVEVVAAAEYDALAERQTQLVGHDFGLRVVDLLRAWDAHIADGGETWTEVERAIEGLRTSVALTITKAAS